MSMVGYDPLLQCLSVVVMGTPKYRLNLSALTKPVAPYPNRFAKARP
jgi:hypothetical protein